MRAEIIGLFLLTTAGAQGQDGSPLALPAHTFEVASVKAAADPGGITLTRGGPGTSSPTLWNGTNWPLTLLIARAWHLPPSRLSGPTSTEDAHYDITARVPPNASADDFNLMLQVLLKERIGLMVHHEMREQPVYEMSIARGGLRMKEAEPLREGEKATAYSAPTPEGGYRLVARMTRFFDIVRWWERLAQRPIIDRTGLSGNFDFVLVFPPGEPQSPSADAPPGEGSVSANITPVAPTPLWVMFPAAVEKQLGLRMEPRKEKADVLVVDRFDKSPSEN